MRVQRLAPALFPKQVSLFSQQLVSPFFRTRTTTTDQQTSLLAGSDRHVLGVRYVNTALKVVEEVQQELQEIEGECEEEEVGWN